jgi:hypothetical protein
MKKKKKEKKKKRKKQTLQAAYLAPTASSRAAIKRGAAIAPANDTLIRQEPTAPHKKSLKETRRAGLPLAAMIFDRLTSC